MQAEAPIRDRAWIAFGKLMASDLPKYTRRRNRAAVRLLLERLGESGPVYQPPFFQDGWHRLKLEDGSVTREAHYFYMWMFGCDKKLNERSKSTGMVRGDGARCGTCMEFAARVRAERMRAALR